MRRVKFFVTMIVGKQFGSEILARATRVFAIEPKSYCLLIYFSLEFIDDYYVDKKRKDKLWIFNIKETVT